MESTKFKYCFLDDKNCSAKFKKAHILSQSATMSLLHGSTKGGLNVVHLGAKSNGQYKPKLIGWKKASTHPCFCHDHDDVIFKPIENDNVLDVKNSEQLFLHSLRSFAYSYYKKKEENQPLENLMEFISNIQNTLGNILGNKGETELQKRFDASFWSYVYIRKNMLEILETKDYDKMEFRTAVIEEQYPFASAGVLMSNIIDPNGNRPTILSLTPNDPVVKRPALILTVLPDKANKTIIIIGALKDDFNAVINLKRFDKLSGDELRKALSSLIINVNKENTFFHPELWSKMESIGLNHNIEVELNSVRGLDLALDSPKLSNVDLFNEQFTVRSLGIN